MFATEKKLSVLLVEDDADACAEIKRYMNELDDMVLVGETGSAKQALEYVKCFLPEAIILDLELHKGSGNGLSFLQGLKQMDILFHPFVLVTTNNSSILIYDCARDAGADFIMAKHQQDYSSVGAVDFLRLMKPTIFNKIESSYPEHRTTESSEQKEKRINRRISLELDYVGVNPKFVGCKYLTDAIRLIIDRPVNNLCGTIGEKYKKTEASVERAMQNAIDRAWKTSDIADLEKNYTARVNSEKGVPTITEFVYYYAKKIRNEY